MSDLRSAFRHLRREPAAALLAILTIGLGIGATTFLFSVANGVLLEPLPFPAADRLVRVTETRAGRAGRVPGTMSNGTFLAWRDNPSTIESLTGWMRRTATLEVPAIRRASRSRSSAPHSSTCLACARSWAARSVTRTHPPAPVPARATWRSFCTACGASASELSRRRSIARLSSTATEWPSLASCHASLRFPNPKHASGPRLPSAR